MKSTERSQNDDNASGIEDKKVPFSLDKETKVSRPVEEHWDKKDDDGDDKDGDDDDGDDVDGDDEDDESDLIMIFAGGMAGRHEVAQGGQS